MEASHHHINVAQTVTHLSHPRIKEESNAQDEKAIY